MGKIEEAIRKASLSHESARNRHATEPQDRESTDRAADAHSRLAPVLYKLQPACKHRPVESVLASNRIIHNGFSDEALTNYKMLRTRLLQQLGANEWKSVAITAAQDGAGKTVTAINLAITLASHGGHDIYLVDLDMRNPSVADYFGLPDDGPGLAAYLEGKVELRDILWDVGVENLVVLANRDRIAESSEQLTSKRMQDMVATFRGASSKPIVIFDLPPVLTADDALAFAPQVDSLLLVVSEGETSRDDVSQALDLLRSANLLGVVLNKAGGW